MKFLKIAVFFIGLSTFAQGKVGAVDIEYILSKMPELTAVQTELENYGKQLDLDLNKKVDAYKKLVEEYKQGEPTFTEEQKNEKQTAIINLENDIQKFQQNGAKLMDIKQTEALKPLYKKIGVALEKVAKAQNYTQVTQTTQDLVYLDPEYDLTVPILLELGITLTEED
ncbi:OmpH family outer membrane protein [Aequorivita nionensis]|jgi:outer membrane protein|uniref:OmpH family outer membrane protein n=1 Tax=Aequorivita nionensis TaxID=1287690 RepID=UPI0039658EA8